MESDSQLLRAFTETANQSAFRTLVERHAGLVFGTAYRVTGDRGLAEEASQIVFTIFAKRAAKLDGAGGLAGWLHRSSWLEAKRLCRTECRHREKISRYAQHAMHHNTPERESEIQARWESALPFLDQALMRLSENDRQILLWHYYEGLTFPQIAPRLNARPATVQKRSVRAMAKLARLLQGNGAAIPATALAAGMAGQFAKAAPSGLGTTLATKALAGTSTLPSQVIVANTILTMKLSKTAIILTTLTMLSAPLVWQRVAIAKTQGRVDDLLFQERAKPALAAGTSVIPQTISRTTPPRRRNNVSNTPIDLDELIADANNAEQDVRALARVQRVLQAQDAQALGRLLADVRTLDAPRARVGKLGDYLLRELAEKSPEMAARLGIEFMQDFSGNRRAGYVVWIREGIDRWAQQAPSDALAWFNETDMNGAFEDPSIAKSSHRSTRSRVLSGLATGLFRSDRDKAIEIIGSQTSAEATVTIASVGYRLEQAADREPLARLALTLDDEHYKRAFQGLLHPLVMEGLDIDLEYSPAAAEFITSLDASDERKVRLLVRAIEPPNITKSSQQFSQSSIKAFLDALEHHAPEGLASLAQGELLGRLLSSRSADRALSVMRDLQSRNEADAEMIGEFIRVALEGSPPYQALFEFSAAISDSASQEAAMQEVVRQWSEQDPDAAAAALVQAGIHGDDLIQQ